MFSGRTGAVIIQHIVLFTVDSVGLSVSFEAFHCFPLNGLDRW